MGCKCIQQISDIPSPTLHSIENIIHKEPTIKAQSILFSSSSSGKSEVKNSSFIYSLDSLDHPKSLLEYDLTLQLSEKIEIPVKLFPECAILGLANGNILCAGGLDPAFNQEVKNCLSLSISNKEISELASLLNSKRRMRLLEYKNHIFCIGGAREIIEKTERFVRLYQDYSENFERYDVANNK